MKFIQITDTHLMPKNEILHGLNPYDRLKVCIDDINQNHRNSKYLGDEVAPLLEKGLEALLSAVEKERLRVATGVDWDEDGYRPDDWRPLRPLRFLGEWLRRNSRTGRAEVAAEEARLAAERAKYDELSAAAKRTFQEKYAARGDNFISSKILSIMSLLMPLRRLCSGGNLTRTDLEVDDTRRRAAQIRGQEARLRARAADDPVAAS